MRCPTRAFVRITIFLFGGGFRLLLLGFRSPHKDMASASRANLQCAKSGLPIGSSTGSLRWREYTLGERNLSRSPQVKRKHKARDIRDSLLSKIQMISEIPSAKTALPGHQPFFLTQPLDVENQRGIKSLHHGYRSEKDHSLHIDCLDLSCVLHSVTQTNP